MPRSLATLCLVAALALVAGPALALDPECESPATYDPASGPYLAPDNVVRFCAPQQDAQGDPLPADYVMTCELAVSGQPDAFQVAQVAPGTFHALQLPGAVKYGADAQLVCLNADSSAGEVVAFTARFRLGVPAAPTLVPGG